MLALEWGNFALSAGFVFVRAVKLLVVAGLNIGRIDRPFLAKGVGVCCGRIELDNFPTVHTKDLLAQDAHRHPYVELLGVIYLMKLRYEEHFGKPSGSAWRLLFVYALFPWLHTYRVSARPELFDYEQSSVFTLKEGKESVRNLVFLSLRKLKVEESYATSGFNESGPPSAHDETLVHPSLPQSQELSYRSLAAEDDNQGALRERIRQLEEENAMLKESLNEKISLHEDDSETMDVKDSFDEEQLSV
jgi:hypothetical protein